MNRSLRNILVKVVSVCCVYPAAVVASEIKNVLAGLSPVAAVFRKIHKRTILIVGFILIYGVLWLMTAFLGTDRVARMVEMELWPSPQWIMEYPRRGLREGRMVPYIFYSTTAIAPFLVLADYGHNMKGDSEYSCIELFTWTPRDVNRLHVIRDWTESVEKIVKDGKQVFPK